MISPGPAQGAEAPEVRPRTLAEFLRRRTDEQLATLLTARPDLLTPVPVDMGQLAGRATTRPSVTRALDRLDHDTLQVVEALAATPEPADLLVVAALLGRDREAVAAAVGLLVDLALVWEAPSEVQGGSTELHLVRSAGETVGPYPLGLGPSAHEALVGLPAQRLRALAEDADIPVVHDPRLNALSLSQLITDPDVLPGLLEEAAEPALAAIRSLAQGPPVGRLANARRDVRVGTARSPIDWLLARGLLVPLDEETVVLPSEVALYVRRTEAAGALPTPEAAATRRDPDLVDRTAGAAAFETVRQVEHLLEEWAATPPPVLRAGGVGVRESRRTATVLDVPEAQAGLLMELAWTAGLVGQADGEDVQWLPTPAYDAWLRQPVADRWAALVTGWLGTTRVAGLVGLRDERGKAFAALGPDLDRPAAPDVRRLVLDVLAAAGPGLAPDAATVRAAVHRARPRRGGGLRDDLVDWTLTEAETLGLTGLGALAAGGRALLTGTADVTAAAVGPALPATLDHILIQGDGTAVAPGPLEPELARELALCADVESRGGATVLRFTADSIRRALDAGRTAADLHEFLTRVSRTPVPQPLAYLVDDVARRHGLVRVGAVSSVLRCEDEMLLATVLADRRAAGLGLRRLAPTVLGAAEPAGTVLARLRAMGYAPAAEAADGTLLVDRRVTRRAPAAPRPRPVTVDRTTPSAALAAAAVRALRAGDRSVANRPRGAVPGRIEPRATALVVRELRAAADVGDTVWIGYVDTDGTTTERHVDPLLVADGVLLAYDHRSNATRTFALHRISGVGPGVRDTPA